jgi:ABC-type uncharacterized transport system involved in gliding motility auxiliary subunit
MGTRSLTSSTGLIVAAALLVTINLFAGLVFTSSRIDLTEDKLYTLSEGTKNILRSIDEPLTLRLYFSEQLLVGVPSYMNYGRRVRDLLEEYAELSDGKINLLVADPEPFSEAEDRAVAYGLQGVPLDAGGNLAYFGLAGVNATDEEEVIPFFQPEMEESLEYELTRLVSKLNNPEQQVIGLISALPIAAANAAPFLASGQEQGDWVVLTQLKQAFEVRSLPADLDAIPDDIDVLMLVHPKDLNNTTLFAIDQFVLSGGRAIVFVDPNAESDNAETDPQNPMAALTAPRSSDLKRLFDVWGVDYSAEVVATDRLAATRVSTSRDNRRETVDYVAWLSLGKANMDQSDFVTRELEQINFGTPGVLSKKDGASIEFQPLMQTSTEAMEVEQSRFQFGPDPVALLSEFKAGGKKLTLAARISGKVSTAFPEGPPTAEEGDDENGDDAEKSNDWIKESKSPVNLIVVADTDILADRFWVNVQNFFGQQVAIPRAANDVFLSNAIDNLSGSNDLISLRSRGKFVRPFERVEALERDAEKRFRDEERALQTKLEDTERKLSELQRQKEGNSALILSDEQRRELEKFRAEQVQTRKALRDVRHQLGKRIETLGTVLKFINIGLVPLLIVFVGLGAAVYRARQLKAGMAR